MPILEVVARPCQIVSTTATGRGRVRHAGSVIALNILSDLRIDDETTILAFTSVGQMGYNRCIEREKKENCHDL